MCYIVDECLDFLFFLDEQAKGVITLKILCDSQDIEKCCSVHLQ